MRLTATGCFPCWCSDGDGEMSNRFRTTSSLSEQRLRPFGLHSCQLIWVETEQL
jgi:hypothetical protein